MIPGKGDRLESFSILLVEDNADDEFITRWILRKAGIHNISVARDGREALERLYGADGRSGTIPDLVMLDLRLPKIEGTAVLKQIREDARTRNLPVLILTSSEDLRDKELCRQLGVIAFVSKPLKMEQLSTLLDSGVTG